MPTKLEYVDILNLIAEELNRAEEKFPGFPEDPIHAAAVVAEESGELTQAALQCTYQGLSLSEMQKEAVHTVTMAVRFLMNMHLFKLKKSKQVYL